MTPTEYLTAEFARYFTDAYNTRVEFHADETITVRLLVGAFGSSADTSVYNFRAEIGSDDDWYIFTDTVHDITLTIPLMPEA